MSHSTYLSHAFDADYLEREFKRLILSDPAIEYDLLVGTGLSGSLSLSALRARLGVDIAIVRKPGDSEHAHYKIESTRDPYGAKWLFVDDLISSGATQSRVIRAMEGQQGEFKGSFLWNPPDGYVSDHAKFVPA